MLGFKYRKLDNGVYSHPVALFIITPQGKISRYLYGFDYPARDVKLALWESYLPCSSIKWLSNARP